MLKRILAFCLIFALAASLFTALPVSAASAVDTQLLTDLGIVDISENTGLIPQGFDRGEFARSLCLMGRNDTGIEVSEEQASAYASDIASDSNRNFIAAVIDFGYMSTDSEGRFNPSKDLTLSETIIAVVKLLGYEPVVRSNGGTYEAYYEIALKLKLLSGVSVEDAEKLTAEETAEILTNAMSAKLLMPDNIHYGEDCLWDRWDIYEHTGRILANSNMGLLVESTDKNRVNIGGNIYYTELLVENELVGSNVTYYTMKGDKGTEVVSIFVENISDTITLKPDELVSVTDSGSVLAVKTEDDTLRVDKKGFLIVNGKAMSPTKAMFDALESGSATFVDSDNNGTYEVVHMTLLFQTVLEGVNPDTETLATRYDNQTIDLGKLDNYEVFVGKKAAALSNLESGMPLGIACDAFELRNGELVISPSEAKYIRLYASRRQDTGYITEMLSDKFAIEGMTKAFGSGYARLVKGGHITPLQAGLYVTAYYDNMGELTYYEAASGGSMQYGYLIAAATGGSALDSTTKVKILGTDGKINIYTTGNKFLLDGESVNAGSTTYTVNISGDVDLKKRQVVRYHAHEDILREIDTMIVRSSKEDVNNTLDEVLTFDTTAEGNSKYKIRSGSIDRKYAFSSDCIMFIDEADIGDNNPNDNMFSVQSAGNIGNTEYYMAGYDANNDNEIFCIVRYDGYGASSGEGSEGLDYWSTYCRVVESVKRAMNDEGTLGWNLALAGDSKQETYFVPEDSIKLYSARSTDDWGSESLNVYKEDVSDFTNIVKSGDIIRFRTNVDGNINFIEKMFDFEDHKDIISEVPDQGGQIYGFAYLEKTRGDYLVYSYDGDERYISRKCEKYDIVPLYHVSTGKVEMIPFEQLPAASSGNTVKCFIRYYNYGIVYDNIFYMYD